MAVYKYLDISTGHISKETAEWLGEVPGELIMFPPRDYGWFLHVPEKDEQYEEFHPNVPKELLKIFEYARKKKCFWIMLDADADIIDGLEKFDW